MPAKKLWGHRRMGEETMRITVVGVILIIATIIAAVMVVRILNDNRNSGPQKNET
jgi:uncharacterized membrane protein YecN with MAPEG domain